MWPSRLATVLLIALALAACATQQPSIYAQPIMPGHSLTETSVDAPSIQRPVASDASAPVASPSLHMQLAQAAPAYAADGIYEQPYLLDSGDRLRISVFGQEGLTNSYIVDAAGFVNVSLIGPVQARGLTPVDLSRSVAGRLRQGYVRDPHVSVEVETYRPFFILGEVTAPGQYPYVANMTVETAVAIAGGFSARAQKNGVELTRNMNGQPIRSKVPVNFQVRPGDTITVGERWF
jgi:protein involved in polysaccharide export with SLBB domain